MSAGKKNADKISHFDRELEHYDITALSNREKCRVEKPKGGGQVRHSLLPMENPKPKFGGIKWPIWRANGICNMYT